MSSTHPTTSAESASRLAIALVFGVAAMAVSLGAGRHAYAAFAGTDGATALQRALDMPRGAQRDSLLHRAQAGLSASLDVDAANGQAWLDLARTRFVQATGAEVEAVSPTLAQAAASAAARAAALQPAWAEPPARLAQARALTDAPRAEVVAPLQQSYRIAAFDESLMAWRPQVAFQVWIDIDLATQAAALLEACAYLRAGEGRHEALVAQANAASDPLAADAMRSVVTDVACWRPENPEP